VPAEPLWYDLRDAVYTRKWSSAEQLLAANPGLVSSRDGLGETVLHFLAVENDLEGVAWLHAHGFDINSKNDFGTPVIFEVAQLGYKDLVLWFISKGGDVAAKDRDGRTIHEYLDEFEHPDMSYFLKLNGA
jgi:ankyrin repeat protein